MNNLPKVVTQQRHGRALNPRLLDRKSDLDKISRLVQNDMSTVVICSKSKSDVEFQYGGRLGKFHGMSSQSHLPHCRVLPPGKFNVMIPELYVTL